MAHYEQGVSERAGEGDLKERADLARPGLRAERPDKASWPEIVQETFAFHNQGQHFADFEVLNSDIDDIADNAATLGRAIEEVGERLAAYTTEAQDMSQFQVVMLWPVTDGLRIARVAVRDGGFLPTSDDKNSPPR